ncbi:MAG: DUF4197 domain-containing protein [Saprospiraceae bacterium]|nr:DUF4197 domain-containing protein [Saprospiraceae bacterium]
MFKKLSILLIATTCTLTACDQLQQAATTVLTQQALSNEDIGNGLKSALEIGIGKGAEALSQKGGYFNSAYKILLPSEARQITEKLKVIPGFNKVEDIILEKINAGAEDAASKAKPIFVSAIKQMTFSDAMNILMGDKNAATQYLKRTTYDQLYQAFSPTIVQSLDKFDARKYWGDAITAYNKIPLVKKANPSLDDYVTREALNGLFSMVEEKERAIRTNPAERITDLLRKVFAKQDNKQ